MGTIARARSTDVFSLLRFIASPLAQRKERVIWIHLDTDVDSSKDHSL